MLLRLIPYCRKTTGLRGLRRSKSPRTARSIYDVLHLFTIDLTRDGHGRLLVPRIEPKRRREREEPCEQNESGFGVRDIELVYVS